MDACLHSFWNLAFGLAAGNSAAFVAKSYFSVPKPAASADNGVPHRSGLPQEGSMDACIVLSNFCGRDLKNFYA